MGLSLSQHLSYSGCASGCFGLHDRHPGMSCKVHIPLGIIRKAWRKRLLAVGVGWQQDGKRRSNAHLALDMQLPLMFFDNLMGQR